MGDAQRLLRIEEEASLKEQKIALLERQVSNLEKENDLLKQQNTIQEKLTELAKGRPRSTGSLLRKNQSLLFFAILQLREIRRYLHA